MASVRMTNNLRNHIKDKAMEAFNNACPQPVPSNDLVKLLRQAIIESPPYKYLETKFTARDSTSFVSFNGPPKPSVFKEEVSMLNLSTQSGYGSKLPSTTRANSFMLTFVPHLTVYRTERWGMTDVRFEELRLEDRQVIGPMCEQLQTDINEWAKNREEYRTKISDLLDRCTSVKQMLMAWPAGESFVPQEFKQRMYVKVTRRERVERIKEEIKFDDSLVNQVVLTSKLVGG